MPARLPTPVAPRSAARRRVGGVLCGVGLFVGALAAAPARADDGLLARARAAERAGDPAAEAKACAALVDAGGPGAAACAARLAWLGARRDPDGGLRGIGVLLGLRARWATLDPEAAAAQVEALAADSAVGARVRADAQAWLARDALERRGDAAAAEAWARPALAALPAGDPDRRAIAALLARALAAQGELDAARAVEAELAPVEGARPRDGLAPVARARAAGRARAAAAVAVVAFAALSLPTAVRGARAGLRPWGLAPLLLVGLGAAALAALGTPGGGGPVLAVVAAVAAVHLLAAPALALAPPGRRGPLRAAAAVATAGAAFLGLDATSDVSAWLP